MLKRSIKSFILCFILSVFCSLNVNAASLESIIEPGDIVIGNTVFKSDDWISASRSSKAGALYATNTGKTDVRVFYYDDFGDWFEYNDTTSKYDLIEEPTLSELGDIINIYYDNNEPLSNKYISYYETEYDEEYDEYYVSDWNEVYSFYNFLTEEGEIMFNDSTVELDYENETITCPYQYVFDFQVVYDNEPTNYKGICGIDEFNYVMADNYDMEEISIQNIELTDNTKYPSLTNQNKVNFEKYEFNNMFFDVTEELDVIGYESQTSYLAFDGVYVAVDITLGDKNECFNYSLVNRFNSNEYAYHSECIDSNTMRVFIPMDSYYHSSNSLLIIDNMFKTYEEIYYNVTPLERPTYELTLSDVSMTDSSIVSNNTLIASIDDYSEVVEEYTYNTLIINTIGNLDSIDYNGMNDKWIAIDLFLNEEVDYDSVSVQLTDANAFEVLDDRIRLYLREDTFVSIYDEASGAQIRFDIMLKNFDASNYVNLTNGFNGEYFISGDYDEGYYEIVKANSHNTTMYYDEVSSKLYYQDAMSTMFRDNDSMVRLAINEMDEVYMEDVEIFVTFIGDSGEGTGGYFWTPSVLDEFLYESISNELTNSEKELTVVIQTFFKDGRETEDEVVTELAKFNDLVEAGTVQIVDISDTIYETE